MKLVIGVLAGLLAAGCGLFGQKSVFEPHRVKRQDQAGSVHVSILSVARWEDVQDALQPTFDLRAADALREVVPTTQQLEKKVLEALQVALEVAPPLTSTTISRTSGTQTGAPDTFTSTRTEERGPGDVAAIARDPSLAAGRLASGLDGIPDALGFQPALDPLLKYSAATALYQEVQLLNRYVRHAARMRGFVPYVVRLQVTLLPRARNEPYDAYTSLAFFAGGAEPGKPYGLEDVRKFQSEGKDAARGKSTESGSTGASCPRSRRRS